MPPGIRHIKMLFILNSLKNYLRKSLKLGQFARKKTLRKLEKKNINLLNDANKGLLSPDTTDLQNRTERTTSTMHHAVDMTHAEGINEPYSIIWEKEGTTKVPEVAITPFLNLFHSKIPTTDIVLIDGVRTPFHRSSTIYAGVMPHNLARATVQNLLNRTKCPTYTIDHIICDTRLPNIEVENAMDKQAVEGFIETTHKCTMACISSKGITKAMHYIAAGHCKAVIAGGVELLCDKLMTQSDKLSLIRSHIQLQCCKPEINQLDLFSIYNEAGLFSDLLATRYGVSRLQQDEFAHHSHQKAKKAQHSGFLSDVITITVPGKVSVLKDEGICSITLEDIGKLEPAFVKPHGSVTTANSTFPTDGASAVLIMSKDKALAAGLQPKAYLRNYENISWFPKNQILLSPTYAIFMVLEKSGLTMADIDVFELHEASAAQMLVNLKVLECNEFARLHLGRNEKVGFLPKEKLNLWGGSLAFGHSLPSTGCRLVTMAANRLQKEGGRFGIVAACDASGEGHAMIIEAYS